jgi:hypothetical protein
MGTHLYNGICYSNILGCVDYLNGTTCNQCASNLFVLNGSLCTVAKGVILTPEQGMIYIYGGITGSNPGDLYG